MLSIAGTARFVSDIHLRQDRTDITERFARFLADCATQKTDALFILGDLFEYWIGDDNLDDLFIAEIVTKLRQLSDGGTRLFCMHGNRDFLIGSDFATATGSHLLAELTKLEITSSPVGARALHSGMSASRSANTPSIDLQVLVLHGDTLCTDDHPYQDFRRLVRTGEWQNTFLAKPLDARRAEVAALRQRSTEAVRQKPAAIMDANPNAVRQTLAASGCQFMIHGHTHRPSHEIVDAAARSERWVLSDWDVNRGDALEIKAGKIQRLQYQT